MKLSIHTLGIAGSILLAFGGGFALRQVTEQPTEAAPTRLDPEVLSIKVKTEAQAKGLADEDAAANPTLVPGDDMQFVCVDYIDGEANPFWVHSCSIDEVR